MRVAALTADPASARFQAVREQGDSVCGEVNGKDRQGAYGGYKRFVYDRQTKAALIDPGAVDLAKPARAHDPACAKPFAYQTVEERLTCAYAPIQQQVSDRQLQFDDLWSRSCGPEAAS